MKQEDVADWSKWMNFLRYTVFVFILIQATDISSLRSSMMYTCYVLDRQLRC